ncbi:MAG: phosphoglucomutase (alpha-D-glucose-1,6-bisphosphate-dependent) [Herbaspirillum sp.]
MPSNVSPTKANSQKISPLAGHPAPASLLVNVPKLVTQYFAGVPDPAVAAQRVAFGTSGHRGSSFDLSFNEAHVLAITQALCEYRKLKQTNGPLYLGIDTHALSEAAAVTALEVLAANGVDVMLAENDEYTPTPVVSHAILTHNLGRKTGLADGIVVTPSHNPPDNGGFKYNPSNGGPAGSEVTHWIEDRANQLLRAGVSKIQRIDYRQALNASTTHRHDFIGNYVADLHKVLDLDCIRAAGVHLGVDPLGGAGVHYWARIAEEYGLDLTVVSSEVDAQFGFMSVDWDGKIRMDPSSSYAMQRLIGLKDKFDVAFACDTDHDRHGIVTKSSGLLPSNHYLAVMIDYLFQQRSHWPAHAAVGKTVVSSSMIDRVTTRLGRQLIEVPVGFKWFVDGLFNGSLGFGGEESAGASFLRMDGSSWTTDKDGIVAALLAAEITARRGRDPGQIYNDLTREFGAPSTQRFEAAANAAEKQKLSNISAKQITQTELAGEPIRTILTHTVHDNAPIGGIKISTDNGWFAARPSGTEDIYKIYAESFIGQDHLQRVIQDAQQIVGDTLGTI